MTFALCGELQLTMGKGSMRMRIVATSPTPYNDLPSCAGGQPARLVVSMEGKGKKKPVSKHNTDPLAPLALPPALRSQE